MSAAARMRDKQMKKMQMGEAKNTNTLILKKKMLNVEANWSLERRC